jgi:ABC-type nickel/cobalt efflux system permease component RcnA
MEFLFMSSVHRCYKSSLQEDGDVKTLHKHTHTHMHACGHTCVHVHPASCICLFYMTGVCT